MASYLQIYNRWGHDGELLARYEVALVKYALYLQALGESATPEQQAWFPGAITDSAAKVQNLRKEAAFNSIIADAVDTSGITDEQISSVVEAIALKY